MRVSRLSVLVVGLGLIPVAYLGLDASTPGSTPRPALLTWTPEVPVQGHLFTLQVVTEEGASVRSLEGSAGGEELHFERVEPGVFTSFAPVPIEATGTVPVSVRVLYEGGAQEVLSPTVRVSEGEYRHEQLTVAPRFGNPDPAMEARFEQDRAKAAEVARQAHASERVWSDEWVFPRDDRVTSGFGNGREFNGEVSSRHLGLDLDGDPGDTVVAVTRGVVELVDSFVYAGNIVYLNHGAGLLSGYFHLSEQLVQAGDTVEAGTPIGRVGATGRVTGPHLHWVVRYGSTSVDPRSLPGLPSVGR